VEELLPICEKLRIPLVVDWHHDHLNPSSKPVEEYLSVINKIWKDRGIKPKQHYSESAPGHPNKRTHSDYIKQIPPCSGDMDLMIEAKMKEQTLLKLYEWYSIALDSKAYPTFEVHRIPEKDLCLFKDVELEGRGRKKLQWKSTSKEKIEEGKGKGKMKVEEEEEDEEEEVDATVKGKEKASKGKEKGKMKEDKKGTASPNRVHEDDKSPVTPQLTKEHALLSTNVKKKEKKSGKEKAEFKEEGESQVSTKRKGVASKNETTAKTKKTKKTSG